MVSLRSSLKPARISSTHRSCAAAMLSNRSVPLPVRRTKVARRSTSLATRATRPSATRRSTMPVTLPFDTMSWRETSVMVMPLSRRTSAAITSNLGKVTPNSRSRRRRSSASMGRTVRSSRTHSLNLRCGADSGVDVGLVCGSTVMPRPPRPRWPGR